MDLMVLRRELSDQQSRLRSRVTRIEADLRRPHDTDSKERATERLNEPVLEALDEHVLAEIRALEATIGRIDRGEFGRCRKCGKPVAEARLAALPTSDCCLHCAA